MPSVIRTTHHSTQSTGFECPSYVCDDEVGSSPSDPESTRIMLAKMTVSLAEDAVASFLFSRESQSGVYNVVSYRHTKKRGEVRWRRVIFCCPRSQHHFKIKCNFSNFFIHYFQSHFIIYRPF